jgi:N-acetylneuraminate synthase
VIGEVAQAHDGSLGLAHAYIDAIADAKADAVKFQTHIASAESSLREPWRVKFSPQDETRYEYWKRMEFSEAQWHGLKRHAGERGLLFISSPFSIEAVELLTRVGVAAWKIASGEIGCTPLLEAMAVTRLPMLVSTGMSDVAEIDRAVRRVKEHKVPLGVLQCTSKYPCPPEMVGLNLIPFFRERYQCGVGLSDHSGTIFPGLAAVTIGIEVLEIHATLSREMYGPDVSSSLTTAELAELVRGIRFIEKMNACPLSKDGVATKLAVMRDLFTKSVVARRALPAGTVLDLADLALKKPGTGIPPSRLEDLIGARLKKDLGPDDLIIEEDLEELSQCAEESALS